MKKNNGLYKQLDLSKHNKYYKLNGGCDDKTRGEAARYRVQYGLDKKEKNICNSCVHCNNNSCNCYKQIRFEKIDLSKNETKKSFRKCD